MNFFPGIGKENWEGEKPTAGGARAAESCLRYSPPKSYPASSSRPAPPCPLPHPIYCLFAPPLLWSARHHFALCSAHSLLLFRPALQLRSRVPSSRFGAGFLILGSLRIFSSSTMWRGRQGRLRPVGCVVEELRCQRREREAGAGGQGRREDTGGGTVAPPLRRSAVVWRMVWQSGIDEAPGWQTGVLDVPPTFSRLLCPQHCGRRGGSSSWSVRGC